MTAIIAILYGITYREQGAITGTPEQPADIGDVQNVMVGHLPAGCLGPLAPAWDCCVLALGSAPTPPSHTITHTHTLACCAATYLPTRTRTRLPPGPALLRRHFRGHVQRDGGAAAGDGGAGGLLQRGDLLPPSCSCPCAASLARVPRLSPLLEGSVSPRHMRLRRYRCLPAPTALPLCGAAAPAAGRHDVCARALLYGLGPG